MVTRGKINLGAFAMQVGLGVAPAVLAARFNLTVDELRATFLKAQAMYECAGPTSLAIHAINILLTPEIRKQQAELARTKLRGLPENVPRRMKRLMDLLGDPAHRDKSLYQLACPMKIPPAEVREVLGSVAKRLDCAKTTYAVAGVLYLANLVIDDQSTKQVYVLRGRVKEAFFHLIRGRTYADVATRLETSEDGIAAFFAEVAPKVGATGPAGVLLWVLREVATQSQLREWKDRSIMQFTKSPTRAQQKLLESLLQPEDADMLVEDLADLLHISVEMVEARLREIAALLPEGYPQNREMIVVTGELWRLGQAAKKS